MKASRLKNILSVLLITFVCRLAQDLFNPYISYDSYTNWKLWLLAIIDAVTLTIGLIVGEMFYRNFKERGQTIVKAVSIILFFCFLVYTFIQQKAFLEESAISIITIIISSMWKTCLFMELIVIVVGSIQFIYKKIANQH